MNQNNSVATPADPSLLTYTHVIYGLHALAALIGITTATTVIGNFLFSVPSLVAVIMNYARRPAVQGTYLASHFTWQIRTFWYCAMLGLIVWAVSVPLLLVLGLGVVTFWIGFTIIGIWLIYRVTRGWLALRDGRAMYFADT